MEKLHISLEGWKKKYDKGENYRQLVNLGRAQNFLGTTFR